MPTPRSPRSSHAARRLIAAAVRRFGSERAAARVLRLSSQAALNKMRRGLLADTPEMKAALLRARKRAERAFYFVQDESDAVLDASAVCERLRRIESEVAVLRAMCKTVEGKHE